ncbi:winged helix-turn-helix domain-containing protein [Bacteroidota bacterium]
MAGSKGSKYYNIFLDYSISLEHKKLGTLLNKQKFQLLKSIHETGSIKAAAAETGISYRKAWGNIEEMQNNIGFKLVNRQRGGSMGGTTTLTPEGIKLIDSHSELRKDFDQAIHKITKKFFHSLNE